MIWLLVIAVVSLVFGIVGWVLEDREERKIKDLIERVEKLRK
jgi:hypothetical protein